MDREYLKKANKTSTTDSGDVRETVQKILDEIETGGEAAAKRYAEQFDRYSGNLVLEDEHGDRRVISVGDVVSVGF